jgi:hypothetical protein
MRRLSSQKIERGSQDSNLESPVLEADRFDVSKEVEWGYHPVG